MRLYTTNHGIAKQVDHDTLGILELPYADLGELLLADPNLETITGADVCETVPLSATTLRAPIPRPSKMFCMSANYHSHLDDEVAGVLKALDPEGGDNQINALKSTPTFFGVPSSAVTGPNDPIRLPAVAPDQVDYEVEVAAVIGKGGGNIHPTDAWAHIAGFTLSNDVSARDLQQKAMSTPFFELGHAKGFDTFKPLGPCLVSRDEFTRPLDIAIETKINGKTRQVARTSGMVHSVEKSIAEISTYFTLTPGDVILTGSPAGVGFFQGAFLKPGDTIEMTAEGIGTLHNKVTR